jgi:hypothetical protein
MRKARRRPREGSLASGLQIVLANEPVGCILVAVRVSKLNSYSRRLRQISRGICVTRRGQVCNLGHRITRFAFPSIHGIKIKIL